MNYELNKNLYFLLLNTVILIASLPLTLFSQEMSTGTSPQGFTKEYFEEHPAVYVMAKNQVLFEGQNAPAEVVVEKLKDKDLSLNYVSSFSGFSDIGKPLPDYDFVGLIDNLSNATVKVLVKSSIGELTFSGNFQMPVSTNNYFIATTTNGKRYRLRGGTHKGLNNVEATITNAGNTSTVSIPCYYVKFGDQVEEDPAAGGPTPPPTSSLSQEQFKDHPIVYVEKNKRALFKNASIILEVSVNPQASEVKCDDISYGVLNGVTAGPSWGYKCLGVLESETDAKVTVKVPTTVGTLEFSKALIDGTDNAVSTLNGKKYTLTITVKKNTVKVAVGGFWGSVISAPCYYVSFGPNVDEVPAAGGTSTQPTKPAGDKVSVIGDALVQEVMEKGYVIAEPALDPNGDGYNFGGRIVKVALSPFARNQPDINPANVSEIEDRISGQYKGYAPLGFPEGKELVVMVDGTERKNIEGRRIGFATHTVGIDLIVNGRQRKLFIHITPVRVPFAVNGVNMDVTMYVVTVGR